MHAIATVLYYHIILLLYLIDCIRSPKAWLVAEGFPHLARLLRESRRTLEGELRTGRCYADADAKVGLGKAASVFVFNIA